MSFYQHRSLGGSWREAVSHALAVAPRRRGSEQSLTAAWPWCSTTCRKSSSVLPQKVLAKPQAGHTAAPVRREPRFPSRNESKVEVVAASQVRHQTVALRQVGKAQAPSHNLLIERHRFSGAQHLIKIDVRGGGIRPVVAPR